MKTAKFYVDFCMEAGGEGILHKKWFVLELSDATYEELYQVWFSNGSSLNNWDSQWEDHDGLFDYINAQAVDSLNKIFAKENSASPKVDAYEVKWELSKETSDEF